MTNVRKNFKPTEASKDTVTIVSQLVEKFADVQEISVEQRQDVLGIVNDVLEVSADKFESENGDEVTEK